MSKAKHRLSVFNIQWCPWRRLSNWGTNIKMLVRSHKEAKQRIDRGFCDSDVYDAGNYILELLADVLWDLREKANGYPAELAVNDDETGDKGLDEWRRVLWEIIDHLLRARDIDPWDSNVYYDQYFEMLATKHHFENGTMITDGQDKWTQEERDLAAAFDAEAKRLEEQKVYHRTKAFEMIAKWLPDFWY